MKWQGWQIGLAIGCVAAALLLCVLTGVGAFIWLRVGDTPTPMQATPVSATEEARDADTPAITLTDGVNRIAILGVDGNLSTVAPDGAERTVITNDATDSRSYSYPTWSPDGATLAYVAVEQTGSDSLTSALHFASTTSGDVQRVETEFPPFYLNWSPTSEKLAFLSNWEGGMALRTVERGADSAAETLREGMPFYFSWQPSGDSLFAHVGSDDLLMLDAEGNETLFEVAAGMFQAPHWSRDGAHLAYVRRGEETGSSVLVISDVDGENEQSLREEEALFSANWSPDSRRIAYSFTSENVGLPAFGALYVEDIESGDQITVSEEPVISFFWSPDGTKLAYLLPEEHAPIERAPEAAPLRQEGVLWVRWHVWDGDSSTPLALFSPTETFIYDYVRYFDQYAQSVSLWSPDSQTLLYAGLSESGLTGVWTLPIAEGSSATRIAPGVLATWSPR